MHAVLLGWVPLPLCPILQEPWVAPVQGWQPRMRFPCLAAAPACSTEAFGRQGTSLEHALAERERQQGGGGDRGPPQGE